MYYFQNKKKYNKRDLLTTAESKSIFRQDCMARQLRGIDMLYKDLTVGRDWLMEMGTAAADLGISIQYGNAYPRQALQALHINSVTQVATIEEKMQEKFVSRIFFKWKYFNISIFKSFNRNLRLSSTLVSQLA